MYHGVRPSFNKRNAKHTWMIHTCTMQPVLFGEHKRNLATHTHTLDFCYLESLISVCTMVSGPASTREMPTNRVVSTHGLLCCACFFADSRRDPAPAQTRHMLTKLVSHRVPSELAMFAYYSHAIKFKVTNIHGGYIRAQFTP